MKKLTKVISMVLVLLMVVSVLGACGDKQGSSENNNKTTTAQNTDKPVEIDWYINFGWYNKKWDAQKALVDKAITDKTGVIVNICTPAGSAKEKLNTMIAADELPDVLTMSKGDLHIPLLQESGMLQPLGELIDEYAPSFRDTIPESMLKWYTADDGNWYVIPNYYWAPEQLTENNSIITNAGMYARKDIMDELGIKPEDFYTQDGMIEALKKVKNANIEYNGIGVVPYCFGPDGGSQTFGWVIKSMFAIREEDENGNYVDYRTQPKMLEALKFANRIYREGLMSKENFASDRNQIKEKMTAGGVFLIHGNISDHLAGANELCKRDNNAQFIPVGPVKAKDGAEPLLENGGGLGWTATMISKKAKNKDKIIKFFEYLYSDEGQILSQYGIEDEMYNMVDGRIKWSDKYLKAKEEDPQKAKITYSTSFYWLVNPVPLQLMEPLPEKVEEKMEQNIRNYFSKWSWNNAAYSNIAPDGGSDEAAMSGEINVYWDKQRTKMILAESESELEKIYNETVEHMNELGLDKVEKVINEKFQKNKSKIGIKYAWPYNEK